MQTQQNTRNSVSLSPRGPVVPELEQTQSFAAVSATLMGIWKLGTSLYASKHSRLYLAQPADAHGSPRFDYVLRTVSGSRETHAQSAAQINRFAAAAAAASHPNLIVVLDSSLHSASPFVVMPRLHGNTLSQWIESVSPQPLPVSLWAVRQTAQALASLHAAGWVHGDVKPSNIFADQQGHVTLLDLGFAKAAGTSNADQFTGTPKYAAPETMGPSGCPALTASDMYSLGKVLLELLAWSNPVIRNQSVLEPIADLIAEMIAESPADRPTAADVATRLLRLEIETLGEHIQPPKPSLRQAA